MTKQVAQTQYLAALRKLGLTPASKATASALGLSVRHCQRLAAGAPIPQTVALLLQCYLERATASNWAIEQLCRDKPRWLQD